MNITSNLLKLENDRYAMDFDDLGKKAGTRTRIMILSSPHNPIGRVWTTEELIHVGEFCVKNHVILVSDEVHSDLVFKGHKHIPTASLSEDIASQTITCIAPSKTFNLAGLKTSVLIIPDPKIRQQHETTIQNLSLWLDCRGLGMANLALRTFFREKARVGFDDGYIFGPAGAGFERVNIACPRSTLHEALRRIERAVNDL